MSKLFTDKTVKAVYDMLRKLPPFDKWNLPVPSKIIFEVNEDPDILGEFDVEPLVIKLSTAHQETFENLLKTTAHEMVHLKLYIEGKSNYDKHDKTFRKYMTQINALFGYDKKEL
jgi:hypothetical protein